jgi:hypothetical protein
VDLLTEAGLGLDMETNGTLLTAELARYLKEETNLGFISVSIDGGRRRDARLVPRRARRVRGRAARAGLSGGSRV